MGTLAAAAACDRATPRYSVQTTFQADTVRLANGDSVELQAKLTMETRAGEVGPVIVFYPFRTLADTARLTADALALFATLRPNIDRAPPPFVVLRGVDVPAAGSIGVTITHELGIRVVRGKDGQWYHRGALLPERP